MAQGTAPVVVGIDGSPSSIHAAHWAAAAAEGYGTSLRLVHSTVTTGQFVADAAVVAIRAAAAAERQAAAEKMLGMVKEAVAEHFPRPDIAVEVVGEPAHEALVGLSRDATLVVVGCDLVSPAAAVLMGSTTLRVAQHASCPVVAWRHIRQPGAAPVVVGVDGTPAGTAALAAAFEFADRFGAPVTAVHSWAAGLDADAVAIPYLIDWEALESAEWELLTSALAPWRGRYPGVQVVTLLDDAKPGQALLDRLTGAQLVVVGNHRGTALSAGLLGSTSLNMLHHSRVPVMVCHAPVAWPDDD
ncbi:MAG: universal stress protein [Actinomycetota bacterium]|nr:universal stress protein [Actinomycetota bacterium]